MSLRTSLFSIALAVAAVLLPCAPLSRAADEPGRSTIGGSGPIENELDPTTIQATEKGLKWLSEHLPSGNNEQVAINALTGLAFLAHGDMPGEGPYGKASATVLAYILKNCQESGLVATPNDGSPMYGHGFATLYLAEVYGMANATLANRAEVGEKLRNAIRLIVKTQQYPDRDHVAGGWRYQPIPQDADISVTICQIMALAARNAGIKVPQSTIEKAILYVKQSQLADGGFAYTLNSGGSAPARSAAGVACLYYTRTGDEFAEEIKRGISYIKSHMVGAELNRNGDGHFYYGNYYATQACFMYGGDAWTAYWPSIKTTLLARQQPAGNWNGENTEAYATAMALIMLQVPNRYLPILQK